MDVKLYGDKGNAETTRKSTTALNMAALEKDYDMAKFGRENAGSSASLKSGRASVSG